MGLRDNIQSSVGGLSVQSLRNGEMKNLFTSDKKFDSLIPIVIQTIADTINKSTLNDSEKRKAAESFGLLYETYDQVQELFKEYNKVYKDDPEYPVLVNNDIKIHPKHVHQLGMISDLYKYVVPSDMENKIFDHLSTNHELKISDLNGSLSSLGDIVQSSDIGIIRTIMNIDDDVSMNTVMADIKVVNNELKVLLITPSIGFTIYTVDPDTYEYISSKTIGTNSILLRHIIADGDYLIPRGRIFTQRDQLGDTIVSFGIAKSNDTVAVCTYNDSLGEIVEGDVLTSSMKTEYNSAFTNIFNTPMSGSYNDSGNILGDVSVTMEDNTKLIVKSSALATVGSIIPSTDETTRFIRGYTWTKEELIILTDCGSILRRELNTDLVRSTLSDRSSSNCDSRRLIPTYVGDLTSTIPSNIVALANDEDGNIGMMDEDYNLYTLDTMNNLKSHGKFTPDEDIIPGSIIDVCLKKNGYGLVLAVICFDFSHERGLPTGNSRPLQEVIISHSKNALSSNYVSNGRLAFNGRYNDRDNVDYRDIDPVLLKHKPFNTNAISNLCVLDGVLYGSLYGTAIRITSTTFEDYNTIDHVTGELYRPIPNGIITTSLLSNPTSSMFANGGHLFIHKPEAGNAPIYKVTKDFVLVDTYYPVNQRHNRFIPCGDYIFTYEAIFGSVECGSINIHTGASHYAEVRNMVDDSKYDLEGVGDINLSHFTKTESDTVIFYILPVPEWTDTGKYDRYSVNKTTYSDTSMPADVLNTIDASMMAVDLRLHADEGFIDKIDGVDFHYSPTFGSFIKHTESGSFVDGVGIAEYYERQQSTMLDNVMFTPTNGILTYQVLNSDGSRSLRRDIAPISTIQKYLVNKDTILIVLINDVDNYTFKSISRSAPYRVNTKIFSGSLDDMDISLTNSGDILLYNHVTGSITNLITLEVNRLSNELIVDRSGIPVNGILSLPRGVFQSIRHLCIQYNISDSPMCFDSENIYIGGSLPLKAFVDTNYEPMSNRLLPTSDDSVNNYNSSYRLLSLSPPSGGKQTSIRKWAYNPDTSVTIVIDWYPSGNRYRTHTVKRSKYNIFSISYDWYVAITDTGSLYIYDTQYSKTILFDNVDLIDSSCVLRLNRSELTILKGNKEYKLSLPIREGSYVTNRETEYNQPIVGKYGIRRVKIGDEIHATAQGVNSLHVSAYDVDSLLKTKKVYHRTILLDDNSIIGIDIHDNLVHTTSEGSTIIEHMPIYEDDVVLFLGVLVQASTEYKDKYIMCAVGGLTETRYIKVNVATHSSVSHTDVPTDIVYELDGKIMCSKYTSVDGGANDILTHKEVVL